MTSPAQEVAPFPPRPCQATTRSTALGFRVLSPHSQASLVHIVAADGHGIDIIMHVCVRCSSAIVSNVPNFLADTLAVRFVQSAIEPVDIALAATNNCSTAPNCLDVLVIPSLPPRHHDSYTQAVQPRSSGVSK